MEALPTLLFLAVSHVFQCVAVSDTQTYKSETFLNTGLNDKTFSAEIVFDVPADLAIHCGMLCSRHSSCVTFTFHRGQCQGHSAVMTPASAHMPASGARSFVTAGSAGCKEDGIHLLRDTNLDLKVTVLCKSDWLVVLQRHDGSVDFYRDWEAYKNGFGSPTGEFWLGLETMHRLTSGQPWELQVTLGDWEGNVTCANYNNFSISSAAENYTLYADYLEDRSQVNDSLAMHSGYQFSTYDADNDIKPNDNNCAVKLHGAWWFIKCGESHLTGPYVNGTYANGTDGIRWKKWRVAPYSLKFAQMKIRPV